MIKAIIFDCFGVLIGDPLKATLDEHALQHPFEAIELMSIIQATDKGIFAVEDCHEAIMGALHVTKAELTEIISRGEVKNHDLLDYILQLRQSHKIGLLSNINQGGLSRRFTDAERSRHFDVVIASGDVGIAKPDIRIYELIAKQLGVQPEDCVFIDDRQDYCDGAQLAGMKTIIYTNNSNLIEDLGRALAWPTNN